jgi:hypothetical protein
MLHLAAALYVVNPEIFVSPIATVHLNLGNAPAIVRHPAYGSEDDGIQRALIWIKKDVHVVSFSGQGCRDWVGLAVHQHFKSSLRLAVRNPACLKLEAQDPVPAITRTHMLWGLQKINGCTFSHGEGPPCHRQSVLPDPANLPFVRLHREDE